MLKWVAVSLPAKASLKVARAKASIVNRVTKDVIAKKGIAVKGAIVVTPAAATSAAAATAGVGIVAEVVVENIVDLVVKANNAHAAKANSGLPPTNRTAMVVRIPGTPTNKKVL